MDLPPDSSSDKMDILKKILLHDLHKENEDLRHEVKEAKAQIIELHKLFEGMNARFQEKDSLEKEVSPMIEKEINHLKSNFPEEFRNEVNNTIEEAQDEIVNMIYPKLDLMIKKYITQQFQKLKESIDTKVNQVKTNISLQTLLKRAKNTLLGVSRGDEIMSDLDKPLIEEIFLVQRNSGLLMGHASIQSNIDQDVIAGMLTAIKSFIEDAMETQQELEMIHYENNLILLHNLPSYYFAVFLSGSISASEKEILTEELNTFTEKEIPFHSNNITEESRKLLSDRLQACFFTKDRKN